MVSAKPYGVHSYGEVIDIHASFLLLWNCCWNRVSMVIQLHVIMRRGRVPPSCVYLHVYCRGQKVSLTNANQEIITHTHLVLAAITNIHWGRAWHAAAWDSNNTARFVRWHHCFAVTTRAVGFLMPPQDTTTSDGIIPECKYLYSTLTMSYYWLRSRYASALTLHHRV